MQHELDQNEWSQEEAKAINLVARDGLTDEAIAEELGINRTTLWRWKQNPEFEKAVDREREAFRKSIRLKGIAVLERRVQALQDRWERMQRVIGERSIDPEMLGVPGGSTGLLVHDVKSIGSGDSVQVVDLYKVDTGLLKELREHEKQAAQELGQWAEKVEHEGDSSLTIRYVNDWRGHDPRSSVSQTGGGSPVQLNEGLPSDDGSGKV